MKAIYLVLLLVLTVTAGKGNPMNGKFTNGKFMNGKSMKEMKILRDERYHPEAGTFSYDFETENGIVVSEAGNENLVRTGVISYPLPNGEMFILKYVADATGFKPESPFLPVAPVFPHPIPPHALRQIERARLERLQREKENREN